MARRVIFSSVASRDIDQIANWIAKESPAGAALVVKKIISVAESLSDLSTRGRRLEDVDGVETRQLLAYDYRVIYQLRAEEVIIATIAHSARELKKFRKA